MPLDNSKKAPSSIIKTISISRDLDEFLSKNEDIKLSKFIQEQLKHERFLREGRNKEVFELKNKNNILQGKIEFISKLLEEANNKLDVLEQKKGS